MPKRIVLDVDTGTDDALAILYALHHKDLDVIGISCVAGNATLDQVVINTCKVLDAAGAGDIPIAAGAAEPLLERARRQGASHGPDGLGGIQLPESVRKRSPLHAVELLRQLIMVSPEPVTVVTLAPKTNLALLLTRYPDVAARLEQIIFMGGAVGGEAATGFAEFNVWQDPEAASIVIESPVPVTMYGLDLFHRLVVDQTDISRFRARDHPAMWLAGELLYRRRVSSDGSNGEYAGLLGDAGAMVLLTNPELFITRERAVRVNLEGIGRGQIMNKQALEGNAGHQHDAWASLAMVLDLDVAKAASAFVETIDAYAA
jgi:pyrimidine-specific ribonucleoside hydrolase